WPEDARPRERMFRSGPEALSANELLAIILGTGSHGETALEMATRLITGPRGLLYLAEADLHELTGLKGVGVAKAARIKAALELGRRVMAFSPHARPQIRTPQDAASLFVDEMRVLDREQFRIMTLNTKNRLLGIDVVSVGSLDSSPVHPREVFKVALKRNAASIILVHNHPSGDPTPSPEDISITRRLVEAGMILGIGVLDHIIVGEKEYTSMKGQGYMD
ncbi:MAG: DNA repair protein RadC, partial [Clostridia bacterium]|nr:DNA repair protein RadC [Clostridia bacterium]